MLGRGVVACLTLVLMTTTANATPVGAQDRTENSPPAILFAFDGLDAELRKTGGAGRQFEFIMPMRVPRHLVTWFTDRPQRNAGHISMNEFVSLWERDGDEGFGNDPPNVALDFGQRTMIATMTKPRIAETQDGTRVLKATLTPLQGVDLDGLGDAQGTVATKAKRGSRPPRSTRISLPSVSVYVDAFGCGPSPGKITFYYTEFDSLCGSPKGNVEGSPKGNVEGGPKGQVE